MKRTLSGYRDLLSLLRSICPANWILFYEALEYLPLDIRKAGISIFRARHIPSDPSSTLFRISTPFIAWCCSGQRPFFETLQELVETPDRAAVSLSLLLSATYDSESISSIFLGMRNKEIAVMESEARSSTIQWSNLLSLDLALHSDFRPAPNVNRFFRGMISRWRSKLSHVIIYPHSSTRSLSYETLRRFNDITGNSFDSISPIQLEQYYCQTGVKIGGVCEMRQVWYPTIANPRTYYAMGGDAYFKSRYLRDIFNYLGDYLPATNRYSRVNPSHLNVESDEDTFIYDLTSFTSMFHEQRYFLDFIADCVDDLVVDIFDSHLGIVPTHLSQLIRDYNSMNKQPEYSLERFEEYRLLRHSVAGFLGVYANLITCTIPHGLVLMTLSDRKMKQWCAGDDAGALYKRQDHEFKNDSDNTIRAVGVYQQEKVFHDNEGDPAIALKRRLIRLPRLLALMPNILFPPFSNLFENDERFPQFHELEFRDRMAKFCSGLMSMMYQMSLTEWDEIDVLFLKCLLPHLYQQFGLPPEGWFPPLCGYEMCVGHFTLSFTIPRILGDFWRNDPTKMLLDAYMPRFHFGRVFYEKEWNGDILDVFECNANKVLRFAVKMGFLDCEEIRVMYQVEEDVRESVYREYLYSGLDRKIVLCRFVKLDDPPAWLC